LENTKLIFDHDLLGTINADGSIKQIWEEEALKQSIKLWIASKKGEALRAPERGGYINRWLMQPMKDSNIDIIKMAIRDGIAQDFTPLLEILELDVKPLYDKRAWYIYLKVRCKNLKLEVEVSERIKAKTT
jgi:hypothetical protein